MRIAALAQDFQPISDMRATAAYRIEVAQGLLRKALMEVAGATAHARRRRKGGGLMVAARRAIATRTVGKTLAHDSAALHVQGQATYVDDIREPEGLVHVYPGFAKDGAWARSRRLISMPCSAAPGVFAVLTAKDIPGVNDCSPTIGGDPILADGKIMFHGQVIFAVVAETRDAARRAARLAKIEIAAEKPAVTVDDAIAMGTRDVGEPYALSGGTRRRRWRLAAHASRRVSASAGRSISTSKAR